MCISPVPCSQALKERHCFNGLLNQICKITERLLLGLFQPISCENIPLGGMSITCKGVKNNVNPVIMTETLVIMTETLVIMTETLVIMTETLVIMTETLVIMTETLVIMTETPGHHDGNPGHHDGNPGHYDGNPGHYDGNPGHYDGNPGHYDRNPGHSCCFVEGPHHSCPFSDQVGCAYDPAGSSSPHSCLGRITDIAE
jgi:hypothetical protein